METLNARLLHEQRHLAPALELLEMAVSGPLGAGEEQ